MREEIRDTPKDRKLPTCGLEEMCVAGWRAWTDCGELVERGKLLWAAVTCGGRFGVASGVSQALLRALEVCVMCWEMLGSPLWVDGEERVVAHFSFPLRKKGVCGRVSRVVACSGK